MKYGFLVTKSEVDKLPLNFSNKSVIIDYYLSRTNLIRWYKETSASIKNDKFFMIQGQVGVMQTPEVLITDEFAKEKATYENVEFLVKKIIIGKYDFGGETEGIISRVIFEDVKNKIEIYNGYLIECDFNEMPENLPFKFIEMFVGNMYDFIQMKKEMVNRDSNSF